MSDVYDPLREGVFKLHAGNDPLGMMGCLLRDAAPSINRGKMSAKVTISRQSPDRARDVMIAKGGRLQNHARNPTVQFQHSRVIPCGRAMDGLGTYTVKMHSDGAGYSGETFFSQNTEIGEQAFRLVESKVLCGASIGFMPVEGMMKKSFAGGVEYLEWELVEYSHVAIPEHPDCLVEAVYKGIGGKPLCDPIMSVLAPMCPPKNETVVGGWDAGINGVQLASLVAKGNTYKTAEAKEVEPLHRESTYYVCPHCQKEITREHIHKDEDGTLRHGECRGAIVLKNPEHVGEIGTHPTAPPSVANHIIHGVPKSLRYTHKPKRFLPGLRTKAMPTTYDDPTAVAPADDTGDFIDPLDDPDEQGPGMKSGAEFMHLVNDWMHEGLQLIEDHMATVDNATAKKTGEKITVGVKKMMAVLHGGYGKYLEEHPDQPEMPGAEAIGPGDGDGDEDEDGTDDFEDDDDGLDSDADGEDADGDFEDDTDSDTGDGEKKPKKKKKGKPFGPKEEKAAGEWRIKANHSYWEDLKRIGIAAGYAPVITKVISQLKGDKAFELRMAVKGSVALLEGLVTKEAKPQPETPAVVADRLSDDWYDEENAAKNGTH